MTVLSTVSSVAYTATGSTTQFAAPFKFFDAAHLVVTLDGVVQTSGYAVVGMGTEDGGTVSFTSPPAAGVAVRIERQVPLTQEVALSTQGPFQPSTIMRALDMAAMRDQQLEQGQADAVQAVEEFGAGGRVTVAEAAVADQGTRLSSLEAKVLTGFTALLMALAGFVAYSASPSSVALTVQGKPAQTANLVEVKDSAGTVLASVSAAGNGSFKDLEVEALTTNASATVNGALTVGEQVTTGGLVSTGSATINGTLTTVGGISTTNTLAVGSATVSGALTSTAGTFTAATASTVPLTARATTGQTAHLLDLKSAGGTPVAYVESNGSGHFLGVFSQSVTSNEGSFTATDPEQIPLVLTAYPAQSSNLFEVRDDLNVPRVYVDFDYTAHFGALGSTSADLGNAFASVVDVSGSLRFSGAGVSKPTCAVGERGRVWFTQGGSGVADTLQVCRKDAANVYAWTAL